MPTRALTTATKDSVRLLVAAKIEERGLSLAEVSKQLGRSHAYMQQYLNRGIPRSLPERIRAQLADLLGVDETLLGATPGSARLPQLDEGRGPIRLVGEYNALVAAGGGIVLNEEEKTGDWPLPRDYLDGLNLSGNGLAVVPVKGDSMEPTLRSGDRVLVDMGDQNVSQGGLFVLWDGNGRVVKRVESVPGARPAELALISDNPLHSKYRVPASDVNIIGRVVWAARRL